MIKKQPAVYILASKRNGTLYTGVTADLLGRVWEHKNDAIEGFTKTKDEKEENPPGFLLSQE